jgi:hypothetical protein
MDNNETTYTLLKWNKKYSGEAKFVVRNNSTGQQAIFTPGRTQDLVWTKTDITTNPEVKDWDEFGDETVSDLEEVAF